MGDDGLVGGVACAAGVPVPSPTSAGLHLGLPFTAGLGHGGGTQASSKPAAKSRERFRNLQKV